MKEYLTKEQTDKLFNTITSNGCREMEETRFHQAVNEAINISIPMQAVVKPANDVIKIIDEMIATSKRIEATELDMDEDCDNETLIDHQGRIYALTQLKVRLSV
ncbi:MAG: hypothetical protein M5U17_01900 [Ignavibacterium sp.]|nr:hypothetical protein [Ignavibacterium sp.]